MNPSGMFPFPVDGRALRSRLVFGKCVVTKYSRRVAVTCIGLSHRHCLLARPSHDKFNFAIPTTH